MSKTRGGIDGRTLLAGRGLLARNTVVNLVGQAAPMVVALVAIPVLIRALGTDRFAILTIAWAAIGYFSLFDLGLSRALTQVVADRLAAGDEERMPSLIWTALALMAVLGIAGGLLLALVAPWIVRGALNIPPALERESLYAFYFLALGLPWVITMGGLRGVLEAYQRFDLVNLVRVPLGVLTYVGPLLVVPFSPRLGPVVTVLVLLRVAALLAHLRLCLAVVPEMRRRLEIHLSLAAPLVRLGGWMTVSNVVSPLMVYVDRFVIGALLPVAAVAYYVTPYEAVTKLWLVPTALTGVFFPALAASFTHDRPRAVEIFLDGVRFVFLLLLPVVLVLTTFAPEVLRLWLGPVFAAEGTGVLRWLAVGVFVNSVAQVAYVAIQGGGRPDVTAKLHVIELPLYLGALWWFVLQYGVTGAAIAWTLRVSVDAFLLFVVAARLLGAEERVMQHLIPMMTVGLVVLGLGMTTEGLGIKAVVFAVSLAACLVGGWLRVLRPSERSRIAALLRRRTVPAS